MSWHVCNTSQNFNLDRAYGSSRFPIWALLAAFASCTPATDWEPNQTQRPESHTESATGRPGAGASSFVWLEGEQPSSANVKLNLAGWGNKQFLSGEKWLHLSIDSDKIVKELPADGGRVRYDFDVKDDGDLAIWVRIGFEFARSPFDWRIDQGPWTSVSPDEPTSDLMEIDFFCEVAWLKLGHHTLERGHHQLEFRLPETKDAKGQYQRVLFALDAVCVCSDTFAPNGKFKPGEDGREARDREAENVVFQFPEPGPNGARSALPLNGLWEICRDDEQQPGPVAEPIGKLPAHPVWRAIAVPGDKNTLRPDLVFAHRVWYRARVNAPTAASGRSFFLVFPQNNLNTTVYVNGIVCGFDKNPFARVQIDVSKAIKPGLNEVLVGIRDAWYGFSASPTNPMKLRRKWNLPKKFFGDGFQDLAYPIWNHPESGILVTPTLVSAGPTYVADVFCKPSVARQALAVDVTLANPGSQAAAGEVVCEAVGGDDKVEKVLGPLPFQLDAGKEATLALDGALGKPPPLVARRSPDVRLAYDGEGQWPRRRCEPDRLRVPGMDDRRKGFPAQRCPLARLGRYPFAFHVPGVARLLSSDPPDVHAVLGHLVDEPAARAGARVPG